MNGVDTTSPSLSRPVRRDPAVARSLPRPTKALGKMTWVETKLVLRDPLTMVFSFIFPIALLLVLGEVFGQSTGGPGEVVFRDFGAMNYYVPTYLAVAAAAFGITSLPTHLTSYRERGVLRRLHASGIRGHQVLVSQTLVGAALASVGAVLVIVLGMTIYEVRSPVAPVAVLLIYLLSTLCFMVLGCLLGAVIPKTRAAQGIGLTLFFVMLFVSGGGPPVDRMSDVMIDIGKALPLYHAAVALQDAWNGLGVNWFEVGILGGVTAAALALTVWLFRWD